MLKTRQMLGGGNIIHVGINVVKTEGLLALLVPTPPLPVETSRRRRGSWHCQPPSLIDTAGISPSVLHPFIPFPSHYVLYKGTRDCPLHWFGGAYQVAGGWLASTRSKVQPKPRVTSRLENVPLPPPLPWRFVLRLPSQAEWLHSWLQHRLTWPVPPPPHFTTLPILPPTGAAYIFDIDGCCRVSSSLSTSAMSNR